MSLKSEAPMSKPPKKSNWAGPIGALLVILSGAAVFLAVSMEKQPFLTKVTEFNMASETHRKIFAECLSLHKQLDELKLPHSFSNLEINLNDPLPSKNQISSALTSCLSKNPKSPYSLQGEVFSSEYEGKDGDIIVLQLSFFDKTGNKVLELNHHWTTSEFEASAENVGSENPTTKDYSSAPHSTDTTVPTAPTKNPDPQNSFKEISEEGKTNLEETL